MNPETDRILAIALILMISIAGCRSTGSNTSFLKPDKKAQLATYKENAEVTKADGNITPPSQLANSSATAELARHRLADSGYPADKLFGPGYEKPGETQMAAAQAPNYTQGEQLVHQSNVKADQNKTPVAYKQEPVQPPTDAALAAAPSANVPPIASPSASPSNPYASNPYASNPAASNPAAPNPNSVVQAESSSNGSMPPLPDMPLSNPAATAPITAAPESPVASNAGSVSSDISVPGVPPMSTAPAVPGLAPAAPEAAAIAAAAPATSAREASTPTGGVSTNVDPQVKPVGYITEQEAQAFQAGSARGVFLPGSLDSTRFDEFNSPARNSDGQTNGQPAQPNGQPNGQPAAPAGNPVPGCVLPGFSADLSQPQDWDAVESEMTPLGIPESAFCSMSYHEVAQLVYQMTGQNPDLVQSDAINLNPSVYDGLRQDSRAGQNVPIVQTAYVKHRNTSRSNSSGSIAVSPESFSEAQPPLLMNILPLN